MAEITNYRLVLLAKWLFGIDDPYSLMGSIHDSHILIVFSYLTGFHSPDFETINSSIITVATWFMSTAVIVKLEF